MKLSRLWSTVLIIAILWNNVPVYIQRFNTDYTLNQATTNFLATVRPESDVELVTNNSHLGISLLFYYYPENVSKYDEAAPMNLDKNYTEIWLIWDGELGEDAEASIRSQNYNYEKIYEGYFANEPYYHVYKLHRNE